jgi:hypothetical protein
MTDSGAGAAPASLQQWADEAPGRQSGPVSPPLCGSFRHAC